MASQNAPHQILTQLRSETLHNLLIASSILTWLWLTWALLPNPNVTDYQSETWLPSAVLLIVILLCGFLQTKYPTFSIFLFLLGLIGAGFWVLMLTNQPELAYFFCLVVIFAGVLVNRDQLILLVLAIIGIIFYLPTIAPNFLHTHFTIQIILLCLTALATWGSTHSLHVAIEWVFNGYEQARKKEQVVHQQKLELLHTMSSLKTAMQQLQETNIQLQQARYLAEEARRIKQNFAQTISHELRTPLNMIVGFTEAMVKSPEYYGGPLLPSYMRDLTIVYRNANHLQTMVNDVLDLARFEKATMELVPKPIDMAGLIQDAIDIIGDMINQQGLTLHIKLASPLPLVFGDAVRLRQILLNLLNNALSFTEKGAITIHAETHPDEVVVCVQDTGVGIDSAVVQEIFEPFRQLDTPQKSQRHGTGLGLTISKHLINLQGGDIWVESTVGVGSWFYFSIPIFRGQTNPTPTTPSSIEYLYHLLGVDGYLIKPINQENLWLALEPLSVFKKNKVLVIDDNQDFVRFMQRLLMSLPRSYQVIGASSASEALALMRKYNPHIVLMDLALPDMRGQILVDAIRAHLRPTSHIIIVTAHEDLTEYAK